MLCQICREREAQVHLSQDVATHTNKVDLCEDCFRNSVPPEVAALFETGGFPPPLDGSDPPESR
jgi:protein-arginine kinase activator protein McsA